jgi:hypothetical protein
MAWAVANRSAGCLANARSNAARTPADGKARQFVEIEGEQVQRVIFEAPMTEEETN